MQESIDEVKKRIANKYLGKEGIHGFGIRHSQNAVCVYIGNNSSEAQKTLLKNVEKEATPYNLLIVREESPKIS